MRPEDFAALRRGMEAKGVKVTNSTPKDSPEKRYATHEEFEAAWRCLGIPVKNVTPKKGEERKQELFLFQGPKSVRAPEESEEEE